MELFSFTDAWDLMGQGKKMKPLFEKDLPYHYERDGKKFYLCLGKVRGELKEVPVKIIYSKWFELESVK